MSIYNYYLLFSVLLPPRLRRVLLPSPALLFGGCPCSNWCLRSNAVTDAVTNSRLQAFSAGSHGPTPSRTSQWASVDVGLIHFAVLDLDPAPPLLFAAGGAQAQWLEADLKNANVRPGQPLLLSHPQMLSRPLPWAL